MSDPAPKSKRPIVILLVVLAIAAILGTVLSSLASRYGRCPLCSGKGFVEIIRR